MSPAVEQSTTGLFSLPPRASTEDAAEAAAMYPTGWENTLDFIFVQ